MAPACAFRCLFPAARFAAKGVSIKKAGLLRLDAHSQRKQKWIAGFSLLGGDPFEPEHEAVLAGLLERIKERFPDKTVWAWTGRTFKHVEKSRLLPYIDRLVDGAYVQKLHLEKQGAWRGSSNQRIIPLYQGRIDESPAAQAEAAAAEAEH